MNDVVLRMISILSERYKIKLAAFNLPQELEMRDPVTERQLTEEEKAYVRNVLRTMLQVEVSDDGASLLPIAVVADPKAHTPWYDDWLNSNNDPVGSYYWMRLKDFLSRELARNYDHIAAGNIIRSIDNATEEIMRQLANPTRLEFDYKGLVVGYVQSGKTANFTALIAKAADAGYKLIIVLTGIHNALRRQTQIRLDRELTGINDVQSSANYIDPPGGYKRWNRLTTGHMDFNSRYQDSFSSLTGWDSPSLAVVKKRVSVLNNLKEYFSQANISERANVPILIIDDEADQASIDTNANDPDEDPTRTNAAIRKILALFPRKAYIGYTATPFANVLIDKNSNRDGHGDDLYPRNFIVALPEPDGYFGASKIFTGALSERFVREIPDETQQLVDEGDMSQYLAEAIDLFLLGCAVRNLRGDNFKPMSMLIHVRHTTTSMATIKGLVDDYVDSIKGRYRNKAHRSTLKSQFLPIWTSYRENAEAINGVLGIERELPDFDAVWVELESVFSAVGIVELNSQSDDTLDYTGAEEVKVIAIGGNQLSRGLTLEGLMISYYLRSARQYDTLFQMGRWFGYRHGYEDLTRIFTTEDLWESFEHLSLVERELRSEIYRYQDEDLTPMDMAVAIRDHQTLTVTAPNKMGAGDFKKISFSKSINQTIWLPLDKPDKLEENFRLGDRFISQVGSFHIVPGTGVYLSDQRVDGRRIMNEFLRQYQFAGKDGVHGPGLDDRRLLEYIDRRLNDGRPELTSWAVAIAGNLTPQYPGDPVPYGGIRLNRPGRSRKYTQVGYNIGVLTESEHLKIDLAAGAADPYDGRTPQQPLLLLYLIAKESKPAHPIASGVTPTNNQRVELFYGVQTEKKDVLGIAIVLPESKAEPNNYIGQ